VEDQDPGPAGSEPPYAGVVAPGFEEVRTVFSEVLAEDAAAGATGSACAVWHDGAWVVDLWGGWEDTAHTRPWTADTLVMPYSVSKPFAAVCVLLLVERGVVALDEPLRTYWPELAAPVTLRQVLGHRAGLVALDRPLPTEAFFDWDLLCSELARQQPSWPPGTAQGESALFYGHLLGEIVRRVDGRSLGRFLREEVCGPRDLDFHVGLGDAELVRVAELSGYGEPFRAGAAQRPPLYARAVGNPPGVQDPAVVNSERWRRAEVPAVNGHGTARAVAGLHVALRHEGLLGADTLAAMLEDPGAEDDLVVGGHHSWGLGVALDPWAQGSGAFPEGFGMGGIGGSFGWWSEVGGYACAFVTGHVADFSRGDRVENAVRRVLGLPPV
jgi:CubicO group peptidase (beta-lactamase class C family)